MLGFTLYTKCLVLNGWVELFSVFWVISEPRNRLMSQTYVANFSVKSKHIFIIFLLRKLFRQLSNLLINIFPTLTEGKLDHYCGGLRPYRHLGTHRTSRAWLQLDRNRVTTLERHAGQPPTTNRTMAHAAGNA